MNPVATVEAFWEAVWNAHDPEAVDRFVVDDFVIVNAGQEIKGRQNFKEWVRRFLEQVNDLHLEVAESFQNPDGSRVASRWRITGKNNGILGTPPDQQDIEFTGTAIWAVREDGKLLCNWVERSAWELFGRLTGSAEGAG
ncbi:ester cyclase [Mycobacterium sp.]|jgi:steroid delta-isomerase-like uncharacterized protein|uniref:ester cyclase n=1 Tax=Mycobacterium sp. TaxID=1785 RepID=UPI002D408FA4|nr:nuclear transport factor 2 family protein [Mycobacterium sp.]HZA12481.1 nuclear transport factor 2 family protein [Mycobacterium sp.]